MEALDGVGSWVAQIFGQQLNYQNGDNEKELRPNMTEMTLMLLKLIEYSYKNIKIRVPLRRALMAEAQN